MFAIISALFTYNNFLFLVHNFTIALTAFGAWRMGQAALTTFMSLCWVLGNFFCIKQATLFGLDVITADVFAIGANISATLLHDYFGQKEAQKGINTSISAVLFFLLMSQFLIWYTPNGFDDTHSHFFALFSIMPRIIGSSLIVSSISLNLNLILYRLLCAKNRISTAKASMIALMISQCADTVLFSVFALYGVVHSILPIIFFSFSIKCLCIFINVPLIHFCQNLFSRMSK